VPRIVESRNSSFTELESSSSDSAKEWEDTPKRRERKYEKFEVKINKKKGEKNKIWEYANRKESVIQRIEKKRQGRKEIKLISIQNRERQLKRATNAIQNLGNEEEVENFVKVYFQEEINRMVVVYCEPGTMLAQIEVIFGALRVTDDIDHPLRKFQGERGWGFFPMCTVRYANRLLNAVIPGIRMFSEKVIDPRFNHVSILVRRNMSTLKKEEVMKITAGAVRENVMGGWWQGIVKREQAYCDVQLEVSELEKRVERRPYVMMHGSSFRFEVIVPFSYYDEELAVFIRNLGALPSKHDIKEILRRKFSKLTKEKRKEKGEKKEKKREKEKKKTKGERRKRRKKKKEKKENKRVNKEEAKELIENIQASPLKGHFSSRTQSPRRRLPSVGCISVQGTKSKRQLPCQELSRYTGRWFRYKRICCKKSSRIIRRREEIKDWEDIQGKRRGECTEESKMFPKTVSQHHFLSMEGRIEKKEEQGEKEYQKLGEREKMECTMGNRTQKAKECL
jgi:hypothetical protein